MVNASVLALRLGLDLGGGSRPESGLDAGSTPGYGPGLSCHLGSSASPGPGPGAGPGPDPGPGRPSPNPTPSRAAGGSPVPSPRSTALLVLGGTPPPPHWLVQLARRLRWWIGVDKGAAVLWQAGLLPHYLVGDLDSLPAPLLATLPAAVTQAGGQVHRYPRDKDATDGELALRWVTQLAQPVPSVILTGGRGGRTAQWLGNLMLLRQAQQLGLTARSEEPGETAWLLVGPQRLTCVGRPGATVNLIPWTRCRGVRLAGLRWPLRGATLAAGSSRGISNVSVMPPVQVELEEGELLVVVEHGAQGASPVNR